MPPKVQQQQNQQQQGFVDPTNEKWVNVTWMPHSTLSQTSHVCLVIRSAHAIFDPFYDYYNMVSNNTFINSDYDENSNNDIEYDDTGCHGEWKIRIGVYGIGGLLLVPVFTHTAAAPVTSRRRQQYLPSKNLRSNKEYDDDDEDDCENYNITEPSQQATTTTTTSNSIGKNSKNDTTTRWVTVLHATHDCFWDYSVQLPIRWRDLPRDSYIQFEIIGTDRIHNSDDTVLYYGTYPFFSEYGKLMTGLQKLNLQSQPLDKNKNYGLIPFDDSVDNATITKEEEGKELYDPVWNACCILDQLRRIEDRTARLSSITTNIGLTIGAGNTGIAGNTQQQQQQQQQLVPQSSTMHGNDVYGQIPAVPWLDTMLKQSVEKIITDTSIECHTSPTFYKSQQQKPGKAELIIELPDFEIPILHEEIFYTLSNNGASGGVTPYDLASYRKLSDKLDLLNDPYHFDPLQCVTFLDYENERDNPVEDKYRTLAHDLLRGLVDPALKPNKEQRIRLAHVIDSPSYHPTREEKDLLWRFRFSLVDNRRALAKFLLAVDWTVEGEVIQAAELLEQWRKRSPIEVTDALKLLGKNVAFQTNLVRSYAIDTLASAPDNELRLYLLQLVQALKYENFDPSSSTTNNADTSLTTQVSSLATFLINRASGNIQLANYLYWYLKVELADSTYGARYRDIFAALKARLSTQLFSSSELNESHNTTRAGPNESKEKQQQKSSMTTRSFWDILVEQDEFITAILDLQKRCRLSRGKKDAKEIELQSLLSKEGLDCQVHRLPVPLPSAPDIFVNGVNPGTAKMFKSALYPALLEFHVGATIKSDSSISTNTNNKTIEQHHDANMTTYKVIVKTGDDLRQDQLVIMMIQLMDGLLKRAALDLCLTPYSILAMSHDTGLVEFVDGSIPISQILYKYNNSILQYFQAVAYQQGAKYDIRPDVMSTYIRSCAGYCVITYILGVGDRHMDNILLRATGHFFHIDFGFIFGRDPKPLPPAFRFTREMVDGMGGTDSVEYRQFCSLACQAYNSLRKSAGLVLNLLNLMSDAGIEDLSNNPIEMIGKVEERFKLNLNDEQAERYFISLLNDCLNALAPRVMDVFHSIAVARR